MSSIKEILEKQTNTTGFHGDGTMKVCDFYKEDAHIEFVSDLMLETKDYIQRVEKHEAELAEVSATKQQALAGLYKAKYNSHTLLGLVRFVKNNKHLIIEEIDKEFVSVGNFREFYNDFVK